LEDSGKYFVGWTAEFRW